MAGKKYVVMNPRGIQRGVRILYWQGKEWYEGDEFIIPAGLDAGRLIRQGYIVEVNRG